MNGAWFSSRVVVGVKPPERAGKRIVETAVDPDWEANTVNEPKQACQASQFSRR